jgi:CRP-like cAMP-binding protein
MNAISQPCETLIAEQRFFKGMTPVHVEQLARRSMVEEFDAGEEIFVEGNPANRFYIILKGKVLLESDAGERGRIPIETLGPGEDLGWSWLFPPYYLQFSARAIEPTRVIFFYATPLRELCERDRDFGYELLRRTAEVVVERLRSLRLRLIT